MAEARNVMQDLESRSWEWRFDRPPGEVWPVVADTARFNEAAKLPKYQVEDVPAADGHVLRLARENMEAINGVQAVEGNSLSGSILITYDSRAIPRERLFAIGEAWAQYLDAVNAGKELAVPQF